MLTIAMAVMLAATPYTPADIEAYGIEDPDSVLYGFVTTSLTLPATSPGPVYHVIGDLWVIPGATLTIEPGVTLKFDTDSDILNSGSYFDRCELIVEGTCSSVGSSIDPISYTADDTTAGQWGRIRLEDGSSGDFQYSRISHAHATLSIGLSSVTLDDILVRASRSGLTSSEALDLDGLTARSILYSGFSTNGGTISNCLAVNCGTGIRLDGDGRIEFCEVFGPTDNGIYVDEGNVTISNCLVVGGGDTTDANGINCDYADALEIEFCTVDRCRYGIYGNNIAEARNTIVTNCYSQGVRELRDIDYCDVWNNGQDYYDTTPDTMCYSYNPLYVDPPNDYHLQEGSPASYLGQNGCQIGYYGPGEPATGIEPMRRPMSWGEIKSLLK
jgi:hypothetical protein